MSIRTYRPSRSYVASIAALLLVGLVALLALMTAPEAKAAPVAAPAAVSAVAPAVAPAVLPAGSNNGTNNWYSSDWCKTSTGYRLDATNYDIIRSGSVWQEYHLDADRPGGAGAAPKVYTRPNSNYAWQDMQYWNDFYMRQSDQFQWNDFKLQAPDGTACAFRL